MEATAGENLRITATIASSDVVDKVELVTFLPGSMVVPDDSDEPGRRLQPGKGNTPGTGPQSNDGSTAFTMNRITGFRYSVEIPGAQLRPGTLRYHLVVHGPAGVMTFPSEIPTTPTRWDFYGQAWNARIVPANAPILLFEAAADSTKITADHRDVRYDLVPSDRPGTSAMAFAVRDLSKGEHDHSFRFYFKEKISGRTGNLGTASKLVLYGKSATDQFCPIQLALITTDGIAYGGSVTVQPVNGAYSIPISSLHQVRSPNIPHGYPVFLHFWSSINMAIPLDLNRVESAMVSIGPGMPVSDYGAPHGINIERIWLE